VDGGQDFDHGALDYLVLDGRHAERSHASIGLRNIAPQARQGLIGSALEPSMRIRDVVINVFLIFIEADPVYSWDRPRVDGIETVPKKFRGEMAGTKRRA
jgi:hypothetical protein